MNEIFKMTINLPAIFFLTLSGFVLRALSLTVPLTGDESAAFLAHWSDPWQTFLFNYDILNHKLFMILSRASTWLFGEHELVFRLPSFLAGVFSIPLLYLISLSMTQSGITPFFAAFFMVFSLPLIQYSQEGRGYSLTVFLALGLTHFVLKLINNPNFKWKLAPGLFGFTIVFCLPSNLHFVVALSFFFFYSLWEKHKKSKFSLKFWIKQTTPIGIMFIIIAIYFLMIYQDLTWALRGHKKYVELFHEAEPLGFSFRRFFEAIEFIACPWGSIFLVFLIPGIIGVIRNNLSVLFLSIFVIPVILILISGIMGPPRVLIYWTPFIFIIIGLGVDQLIIWTRYFTILRDKEKYIPILFSALIIILAYPHILNFYDSRNHQKFAKIKEAKEVRSYLQTNGSNNDLLVIPFFDRVLRFYLEEQISQNMLNILKDGKLNKIRFLNHRENKPEETTGYAVNKHQLGPLKDASFVSIKDFGELRLIELDRKAQNFIPPKPDSDYMKKIELNESQKFKIQWEENPSLVGSQSMLIIKKIENGITIFAKPKLINMNTDGNLILLVYAHTYKQNSKGYLAINGKSPKHVYLNPYYGVYSIKNNNLERYQVHPYRGFENLKGEAPSSSFKWEIIFYLISINKGLNQVSEVFHLDENTSHFDGYQSFILYKEN